MDISVVEIFIHTVHQCERISSPSVISHWVMKFGRTVDLGG